MFILPELGYEFDALEPHIDAQTMQIHHDKHHATYVEKLNKALEAYPDLQAKNIDELLSDMNAVPAEIKTVVQNNGGGHLNHSIFWIQLTPGGSNVPEGDIAIAIDDIFGGFEALKEQMSTAATNQFGSGWAWLAMKPDGSLFVQGYPNQNSPLMDGNHPIMGIDVWEHAYYLKYQNKRADYVTAIWNVINWDKVGELYDSLRKM